MHHQLSLEQNLIVLASQSNFERIKTTKSAIHNGSEVKNYRKNLLLFNRIKNFMQARFLLDM